MGDPCFAYYRAHDKTRSVAGQRRVAVNRQSRALQQAAWAQNERVHDREMVDPIFAQELPGTAVIERAPEDIDAQIQQGVWDHQSSACRFAAIGLGGGSLAWLMVLAAQRQPRRSDP